jgi:hypothetical protein
MASFFIRVLRLACFPESGASVSFGKKRAGRLLILGVGGVEGGLISHTSASVSVQFSSPIPRQGQYG